MSGIEEIAVIHDPGHGGTDSGAYANGQKEKEWTLEAATYVNSRLSALGVKSSMTRTTDKTLDSGPRTDIVKRSGADICLSHHFNAGGGVGYETIYSIYSNDKLAKLIGACLEEAGQPCHRIYNRKGSHGDYYYMHRETGKVQTIIIEYGYLDSSDYNKLKDKAFRFKLYEAVVRAVCGYVGVKYQEVQPKPIHVDKVLHRVMVDGKQVGAYDVPSNVSNQVELAIKKGAKKIVVEKV